MTANVRFLAVFFVLTFALTWACFFAADGLPQSLRMPLFLLGVFAPGLIAIALTAKEIGRSGVSQLLRPLFRWRVAIRWYVFAIGYMIAVKLAVAGVVRIATGAWPRFGDQPWVVMVIATLFSTLIGGQAGEEIGWRGYALPRLASHIGFASASVLLGVIWAFWHLPLFFLQNSDTTGQSFPMYVLQVTAMSIAFAWVYVGTKGSLLLTMLMHAAVNNFRELVPSATQGAANPFSLHASLVGWLTVLVLWLISAVLFVRLTRSRVSGYCRPDP